MWVLGVATNMSQEQQASQDGPELIPLSTDKNDTSSASTPVKKEEVANPFKAILDAYAEAVTTKNETRAAGIEKVLQNLLFNIPNTAPPKRVREEPEEVYDMPPPKRRNTNVHLHSHSRAFDDAMDENSYGADSQYEDEELQERFDFKMRQRQQQREVSPASQLNGGGPKKSAGKAEQVLFFSEHSYVRNPDFTPGVAVQSVVSKGIFDGSEESGGQKPVQKETAPVSVACFYIDDKRNELMSFPSPKEGMTKNRAMMYILIHYLNKKAKPGMTLQIVSDNDYVLESITKKLVYKWRDEGWGGKANVDLWKGLLAAIEKYELTGGRILWLCVDCEDACQAFEGYGVCRKAVLAELRTIQEQLGGRVPFKPRADAPPREYNGGGYSNSYQKSNYKKYNNGYGSNSYY